MENKLDVKLLKAESGCLPLWGLQQVFLKMEACSIFDTEKLRNRFLVAGKPQNIISFDI